MRNPDEANLLVLDDAQGAVGFAYLRGMQVATIALDCDLPFIQCVGIGTGAAFHNDEQIEPTRL